MSVVGIDLGNDSCVVAVARQRGIDVVLNDESSRETPAVVSFSDKQRFLGTAAASAALMNPRNTVSDLKRLLSAPAPAPVLVRYLSHDAHFTPTELLAMLLSNLRSIAERNLGAKVADCCIGIPVHFTDSQRRAVADAAAIAGLHPLRLLHETTATALAYGIYKTDLPENKAMHVVFVDIGSVSMQVCVAAFRKGQVKVLAHGYELLGGRDFDEILFRHFAGRFKEEYGIDVGENARAGIRLRAACEKMKKVLSANPEAPLNIECLMDEKDVRGFIKREEFERLSVGVLERVKGPLEKALVEAGLTVEDVHSVEVVGSGSRVPAIMRILTEFFGKEPRRTMNVSECVARGCALQCAMLSPTFKVRDFQVHESFPFSIALSWKSSSPETQNEEPDNQQNTIVFPKGNPIPSVKVLTFYKSNTFTVDVHYADSSGLHLPAKISTYTIGPFNSKSGEPVKLEVKVCLNLHGIISVESATMFEDEEVDIPCSAVNEPPKESTEMETDEVTNNSSPTEGNLQSTTDGTGSGFENDADGQVEMDTKDEVPRRKVKKTDVPVSELVYGGMLATELQKAVEREFDMALQDRVMEETKDKKNAVESYVYDMRNKLHDKYQDYVSEPEREDFITKLQHVEDWLYEDGEDETKGVYVAKLEELKKQGDPIEERFRESTEREPAVGQLVNSIRRFREAALSHDPKFDHIDIAEKQKVTNECAEAETWLAEKMQQQVSLPKYSTPVLLVADLKRKVEALDRLCRPIMTKRRPPPAKPQTPPSSDTSETAAEDKAGDSPADAESRVHEAEGDDAVPDGPPEPMDTDKPDDAAAVGTC